MFIALSKIYNLSHIWNTFLGAVFLVEMQRAMTLEDASSVVESLGMIGVLLLVSWLLWKEKRELTTKIIETKDKEIEALRMELKSNQEDNKKLLQIILEKLP